MHPQTERQQMVEDVAQSAADRWREYTTDDVDDVLDEGILDAEIIAGLDGEAREARVITGVGGPFVRVNLTTRRVYAAWGGETTTWSIVGNDDVLDEFEHRLFHYWEAAVA